MDLQIWSKWPWGRQWGGKSSSGRKAHGTSPRCKSRSFPSSLSFCPGGHWAPGSLGPWSTSLQNRIPLPLFSPSPALGSTSLSEQIHRWTRVSMCLHLREVQKPGKAAMVVMGGRGQGVTGRFSGDFWWATYFVSFFFFFFPGHTTRQMGS